MTKPIDKTRGPVKVAASKITTAAGKKPPAKQARMGHSKVTQKAPAVVCSRGHPTQLVHYNLLRNMRRWCPACQELV